MVVESAGIQECVVFIVIDKDSGSGRVVGGLGSACVGTGMTSVCIPDARSRFGGVCGRLYCEFINCLGDLRGRRGRRIDQAAVGQTGLFPTKLFRDKQGMINLYHVLFLVGDFSRPNQRRHSPSAPHRVGDDGKERKPLKLV
jgi:hypothetical protein